jgi:hypothetical protein
VQEEQKIADEAARKQSVHSGMMEQSIMHAEPFHWVSPLQLRQSDPVEHSAQYRRQAEQLFAP